MESIWANYSDQPAEVTPNGSLVRESPPKSPKHSGLGIIVIWPESIDVQPIFVSYV